VRADAETRKNLISSIYLEPDELEAHNRKLQAKYREIEENEALYDEFMVDDAKIVVVAYGIVARVARSAVAAAREEGIPAGLFRPVTLWPFPRRRLDELAGSAARLQVFELSYGQMLDDVRLAIHDRIPVGFHGRMGGNVPSVEECLEQIRNAAREGGVL